MSTVPQCPPVQVHTFRGDRTSAFRQGLFRALDEERNGRGPGPSRIDSLLYAVHTGVSIDSGGLILGFNPDGSQDPTWQVHQNLRTGNAYPGVVLDDTAVFVAALPRLPVLTFDVISPPPAFASFRRTLNAEIRGSRFSYRFPDGDDECNCTTWLKPLVLPLLTGRVEFTALGVATQASRRFELCN